MIKKLELNTNYRLYERCYVKIRSHSKTHTMIIDASPHVFPVRQSVQMYFLRRTNLYTENLLSFIIYIRVQTVHIFRKLTNFPLKPWHISTLT